MEICCYEFVSADSDILMLFFLLDYIYFNFVYTLDFIHKYNLSIFWNYVKI
jgi:hypothetical protein